MFEKIIFFSEHGKYDEAEKEINLKLESVEENSSAYIILKTFYAYLCRDRGQNNEAMELLAKLNEITHKQNHPLASLYILTELSYNHWKLSHYDTVIELIKELELIKANYTNQKEDYGVFKDHVFAKIYNIKGLVKWHQGLLISAAENFTQYLEISKKLGHDHGIGVANNNLAALNYQLGNIDNALIHIKQSIIIWTKLQKIRGYAYAYKNLGLIYYAQNKIDLSLTNFELALDRFGSIENQIDQAVTLFNMILVCLSTGEMSTQVNQYLAQLKEMTIINSHSTIANHYEMAKNIAYMYAGRLKEISKAYSYFEEFVKNEELEFKLVVFAVRYICEYLIIELKNNNLDEIFDELTSYVRKLKELGSNAPSHSVLVEALILEGKLIFATGEINQANDLLASAKTIALDHGVLTLVQRVEEEQSLFNSRIINIRKMLEADATKYELLDEIEMKDYIDEIKKILDL
ncbi:MAG: tetratricopeptide repeat protein [Candidatus Heimdallarchaeota archaeon]|nr:tetratricopeptide repeat protein [Candidatus Heimdallarchaeota archaeon]